MYFTTLSQDHGLINTTRNLEYLVRRQIPLHRNGPELTIGLVTNAELSFVTPSTCIDHVIFTHEHTMVLPASHFIYLFTCNGYFLRVKGRDRSSNTDGSLLSITPRVDCLCNIECQ